MVLVDSSIWIDHFRRSNANLVELLNGTFVLMHPHVLGELACGNLKDRRQILNAFHALPSAKTASHREVMQMVEQRKLWGNGIGWVDANLLASALLEGSRLWTRDERLNRLCEDAGIAFKT